jgi:benzoate-CoA ligase
MKSENRKEIGRDIFNIAWLVDEAARRWGDRVGLFHYETEKTCTYKEVAYMASRVGNGLRALGIEIENRVAILMDDSPEWVYALFGALKIGAVPIPLNTLLSEKDYAFFLNDSRAKVLFVGASLFDKIKPILSSLRYLKWVVVCNGNHLKQDEDHVMNWEVFIKGTFGDLEVEPTVSSDVALFMYSSGSTGRPRAIMHSHMYNLTYDVWREIYKVGEGDVQFHISKLYFSISLGGLINAFNHGSSFVLLSGRPLPMTVLKVIARYKPTFLAGAPTILARMVDAVREAPYLADLSSVRYIFCTGEVLSREIFQRFLETFGKPLYNNWGSQELASAPLAWRGGEKVPMEKAGSLGSAPIPGAEVKIVDEHGNEVPVGTPGEAMVRVKGHFLGYWHEPEEAARKFFNGWYKTDDFFMRDQDGYFWHMGRQDDMVKIGGRQVFPVEVEEAVARHPAVMEGAVVPAKGEHGLTELHAFVVLKEGYSPSPDLARQIQNFVKEELAPFKRPQRVEFVSELPKTATGKIQRFRLREQTLEPKSKSGGTIQKGPS